MLVTPIEIELDTINYQDSVRAGLTALPNATAGASGGVSLVGSAMTLTSGERTAIANEVEAQIIDDTDTEKVLEAIVNKINSMTDLDTLSLAAIATAVRNELATELARIDATVSSRMPDGDTTVEDTYTQVLTAITSLNTLLNRLGAFTGSGTNTVLGILKAMCRKDLSAPSDVGGTFSPATDSLEGIADTWDQLTIAATGFAIGEDRNKQSTILSYTEEDSLINIYVYDSEGAEVNIEAFTMNITFEPIRSGTTYTVADGDIVLKDGNNVRFYPPAGLHDDPKHFVWSLRKESPNALLGTGTYKVVYAP